jgi:protein phosphatase
MVQMTHDVQKGDIYLLCSDGLTDMVPDPRLCELLGNGADADALCVAAIEAGGIDNVSCCVIRIK